MSGPVPARSPAWVRLRGGVDEYVQSLRGLNANCWLLFLAGGLAGIAQGIFAVDFNLYILSLGVGEDALGGILSASPFAQALASIPVGFLAEAIGFKLAFVLVFLVSALAKVGQLVTGSVPLIALAAFVDGLALAGSFVVRLPFLAANAKPESQTQVYTINSMLFSATMSLGSLLASYLPNVFGRLGYDLPSAYRYSLLIAAVLTLVSVVPIFALRPTVQPGQERLKLGDFLWRVDRFVMSQASVTLFVGLSTGLIAPFMNLLFIDHLGTTREFYGAMSALALFPAVLGAALIPAVAMRTRSTVRLITSLRLIIPGFLIVFALTPHPWVGTVAYWSQNTFFFMTSPLAFAFAMDVAKESRSVLSAWLNVAFWIGNAAAAPITGALLAQSRYALPLYLASIGSVVAALLNQGLFGPVERRMKGDAI